MEKEREFKACPFCGSKKFLVEIERFCNRYLEEVIKSYFECNDCGESMNIEGSIKEHNWRKDLRIEKG